MNEEIAEDVHFTRGYNKGYSDAQESLARKMDKLLLDYRDSGYERGYSHATKDLTNKVSKTIMDDRDAGYDQGIKDCYRILKEQLDEMIENCRFQDEYGLRLVREKLFNKNG
jgi:uncharacterized protein (DUF2164 family)